MVEKEVSGLRKKLTDAEREQLEQEQELCNVRYDVSISKMSDGCGDSLLSPRLACVRP